MKILIRNLLLSFYLCAISCSAKEKNQARDIYNLGFESNISMNSSIEGWYNSASYSRIQLDSVQVKEGKYSAKVFVLNIPSNKPGPFCIFQPIHLPVDPQKLEVSIWVKEETSLGGSLKCRLLDSAEKVVSRDSTSFIVSHDWTKYTINFDRPAGRILYIEVELPQGSQVWLDQCEIHMNGKSICEYETKNILSDFRYDRILQNPTKIELNDSVIIGLSRDLKGVDLVGIGESVHRSHEMVESRNQLIKYLVKYQNCRLIILEAPADFVEQLNGYIQGNLGDEEILNPTNPIKSQTFHYSEETRALVHWLKDYNKTAQKKVSIAGMDFCYSIQSQLTSLIREIQKSELIKRLRNFVQNSNSDSLVYTIQKNDSQLRASLTDDQYARLKLLANRFDQYIIKYKSPSPNSTRDSIMAENVKTLLNQYGAEGEISVINAHLMHLNKTNLFSYLVPSLGKRLFDFYGGRYFVIGQLVGEGQYLAGAVRGEIHELFSDENRSIESVCSKVPMDYFYSAINKSDKSSNSLMMFRSNGGMPQRIQFFPGNLSQRIDAVVFIRKGSPLRLIQ